MRGGGYLSLLLACFSYNGMWNVQEFLKLINVRSPSGEGVGKRSRLEPLCPRVLLSNKVK